MGKFAFYAVAAVAVAVFSGCMTNVTVVTDPPGAIVYSRGHGRTSYKWAPMGSTKDGKPVTFRVSYNAIDTLAKWPAANGRPTVMSEITYVKLFNNGGDQRVVLKPAVAK